MKKLITLLFGLLTLPLAAQSVQILGGPGRVQIGGLGGLTIPIPISQGGTGAITATSAFNNLLAGAGLAPSCGLLSVDVSGNLACGPVGALTSLNGLTGPALTLTSSDSSVTITPSGTSIDLKSIGGGGSGVQYNPATTEILIMGASNNGDDQANTLGPTFPITSWSCNSVTCSFINTGSNGFAAGDWVFMKAVGGWPNSTTLNTGVTLFKVDAAGLSSTTFQVTFGPNYSFTGSGTGGTVEAANGFLPVQISNAPFFKGHGVMSFIGDTAQSLAANFNTAVGTATTNPAYLILTSLWTNDIGAKRTAPQIEADLATVWAAAHANGWKVIQGFDYPIQWNTSTLGNPNAYQTWAAVYKWIQGQGWNVFDIAPYCSTTCGQYWDSAVDNASILRDGANTNLSNNGNLGVLSTGGVKRLADYYNAAMANQGSIVGSYPSFLIPAPFASGSLYGNTFGYAFAPTADSHQAFNFYNAALTIDFLNIDTVSNIIQLPVLTPAAPSLISISSSNGQLGTLTIQGTDTAALSGDPTSISAAATGAPLCKSANGGATATGCTSNAIANTTTSVGTTAIAANTCTAATTVTMTGVVTTSVFDFVPSSDITTVTGWGPQGGLTIVAWPTANTLNYKVCNQTASSITPTASVTFNVGAR